MQLNGYSLNVMNKTIKDTLQCHISKHKSKELEPLKMFLPYEKGVAEKLKKGLHTNMGLQQSLQKQKT